MQQTKKEFPLRFIGADCLAIFLFVSLDLTSMVATVGFKQEQECLNKLTPVYFYSNLFALPTA